MVELVAITGASGFIGRALVEALLKRGWRVRALLRRPDPRLQAGGVEAVFGSIEDVPALTRLAEGANAVVHAAGLIKAVRERDFFRVNAGGTARLLDGILAWSRPPRILLVSSLAARAPQVSAYAASKRAAEHQLEVRGHALEHVVVRPPAVYGPGDRSTLPLLRLLSRRVAFVPAPASGRFSLLFIDDLVALLVLLLRTPDWQGSIIEPDDGQKGGYTWTDLISRISDCLGKPIRGVFLPQALLSSAAAIAENAARVLDRPAFLSRGKVRELFHADWLSCRDTQRDLGGWRPLVQFCEGFERTMQWYRTQGWL